MTDLAYSSPSSGEQQSHRPSPQYALPASSGSIEQSLDSSWFDTGGKLEEGFISSDPEAIPFFPGAPSSTVVFTEEEVG